MFLGADRNFDHLAHDRGIAFVRRVHRNRTIAQHGFGAGRGDRDVIALFAEGDVPVLVLFDVGIGLTTGQRVFEMPHVTGRFDVLDLKIRDRGLKMRVPVGQAFAAIDQALVVHIHKDLDDGVVEIAILIRGGRAGRTGHRKGVARPVTGVAKAFHLVDDGAAFFGLPFPDLGQEFVARHVAAFAALFGHQFLFDLQLGRDTGVVLTGLPQGVEPAHPVPTHQDVHDRVVERVTHVQRAGDVRRGQHDRKRLIARRVCAGLECAGLFPCRVQACFGLGGVKGFFHRHSHPSHMWFGAV